MSASHEDLNVNSCGFYVSADHPFLGASPDALTECECCGRGVVEVKCPLCGQESSFAKAARGNRSFCLQECNDGKFKLKHQHDYYYQCQLQIFVTGHSFCDFVVWTEKELHIERLTLDETLITSSRQHFQQQRNFSSSAFYLNFLGSGTRANIQPQETMTH